MTLRPLHIANASRRAHVRASMRVSSMGRPGGARIDNAILQFLK